MKDSSEEKKFEKKVMPEEKKPEERKDVPEEKKIEKKKEMPEEKKPEKRKDVPKEKKPQKKKEVPAETTKKSLAAKPTKSGKKPKKVSAAEPKKPVELEPDNGGKPADQDGKVMEKSGPKMALHPADKCETDKIPAANASKSGSKAVSKPETVDSKEIKEPKCSEIKNSEDARKILPGVPSTVPKPKVKTAAKSKSRNTAKPNVSKPSSSTPKVLKTTTKTSKKETMEKDSIEKKLHCVSKLLLDFCGKVFFASRTIFPFVKFSTS